VNDENNASVANNSKKATGEVNVKGANGSTDEAYNNSKSKAKGVESNHTSAAGQKSSTATSNNSSSSKHNNGHTSSSSMHHHLLPLPLVYTVLICSGLFWMTSFRDVMATGKPILNKATALFGHEDADANYLVRKIYLTCCKKLMVTIILTPYIPLQRHIIIHVSLFYTCIAIHQINGLVR
jgi:hypothetical protein